MTRSAIPVHGGVYLCQVSETVSCGACCGLYNLPDAGRPALTERLRRRTAAFRKTPRTTDAIDRFGAAEAADSAGGPYPDFHHCPFVGLIDGDRRVGCLLHPRGEGNAGIDWRGLSYYGGLTCEIYFCATYTRMSADHKTLVCRAADDWYDYGLVITEHRLLTALFEAVEARLGRGLEPADLDGRPVAVETLRRVIGLKARWPARRTPLCHPIFDDPPPDGRPIDYPALGRTGSPWDTVLRELNARIDTPRDLADAEARLTAAVDELVHALEKK